MKIELFVGYIFFCSFWAIGIFKIHCFYCSGSSYEECQRNLKLDEYPDFAACMLYHVRFENGSAEYDIFFKGVIPKHSCEQFSKGNITDVCYHPLYECKAKCCYEDYCNKGNILDTGGQDSSSRKAIFISDGVVAMGLFLGVSITAFSVN